MGEYTRRLMQAIQENPYGRESEMALRNGWVTRENLDKLREQKGYVGNIATDYKSPDTARELSSLRRGVAGEQTRRRRRGRGWMQPAGFSHFLDAPEGYEPGMGESLNRGEFLDNLDRTRRSPIHRQSFASSGLARIGANSNSPVRSDLFRAMNSYEGRAAQQNYTADMATLMSELRKKQEKEAVASLRRR